MKLLSIDPGKSHYAWAIWTDADSLHSCGRQYPWKRNGSIPNGQFKHLVIELPQIYRQSRWKGDPNDLIQVALTVGALESRIPHQDSLLVHPHDWKGSTPKNIMEGRILDRLSDKEKIIFQEGVQRLGTKKHDVVDAVGIGLWALLRL